MDLARRISGFVEDLANQLCRAKIVLPLLLVVVAGYLLYAPVFGWALTAVCMLAILWLINQVLQRFVAGGSAA